MSEAFGVFTLGTYLLVGAVLDTCPPPSRCSQTSCSSKKNYSAILVQRVRAADFQNRKHTYLLVQ